MARSAKAIAVEIARRECVAELIAPSRLRPRRRAVLPPELVIGPAAAGRLQPRGRAVQHVDASIASSARRCPPGNPNGQIGETIAVEIARRQRPAESIALLGSVQDARLSCHQSWPSGPPLPVACSPAAEPYSTLTPPSLKTPAVSSTGTPMARSAKPSPLKSLYWAQVGSAGTMIRPAVNKSPPHFIEHHPTSLEFNSHVASNT